MTRRIEVVTNRKVKKDKEKIKGKLLEVDKRAKRKIRDSVFTKLFKDKHNVVELNKALHPDDIGLGVEDVDIVTIGLVLTDGMYNDLGFSVRGEHGQVEKIILVEAQTKWDENMAERMSIYAQKTRERYWRRNEQYCHQDGRMYTPVFEHYVVYTGDDGNRGEYMMLHDCTVPKHSMNLGVKVITKVDDSILGQYIGFCKVYSYCLRKYREDKGKVLNETINMCMEKGYLVEFLKSNLWEVRDIMSLFTNQALAVEIYGNRKKREGEKIGREKGEKRGREEGEKIGREDTAREAIKLFFPKDKEKMELLLKDKGISIEEYMDICAKRLKMDTELFIRLCANNSGVGVDDYKREYGIG